MKRIFITDKDGNTKEVHRYKIKGKTNYKVKTDKSDLIDKKKPKIILDY